MTDKERILMAIIKRIIPGILYSFGEERDEYVKSSYLDQSFLQVGDLVIANTTIRINDYVVGFVHEINDDCVVIREIGSERLCNYYNEIFTKINKDKLGYEILEGLQYKTYIKVLKAFASYADYMTMFKGIQYDGKKCTVQARKRYSNDLYFEFSFCYNSKTTIRKIGDMIIAKESEQITR